MSFIVQVPIQIVRYHDCLLPKASTMLTYLTPLIADVENGNYGPEFCRHNALKLTWS